MLRCAEVAEPGPDRIFCLWSAAGRIDNARRGAKIGGIKLLKRIAILDSTLRTISCNAGSGAGDFLSPGDEVRRSVEDDPRAHGQRKRHDYLVSPTLPKGRNFH
jgi:hypothetical protein